METNDVLENLEWRVVTDWSGLQIDDSNWSGRKMVYEYQIDRFFEKWCKEIARVLKQSYEVVKKFIKDENREFFKFKERIFSNVRALDMNDSSLMELKKKLKLPVTD